MLCALKSRKNFEVFFPDISLYDTGEKATVRRAEFTFTLYVLYLYLLHF